MPEGNEPLHLRNWVNNCIPVKTNGFTQQHMKQCCPIKEAECFLLLHFCSISFQARVSKAVNLYLFFFGRKRFNHKKIINLLHSFQYNYDLLSPYM